MYLGGKKLYNLLSARKTIYSIFHFLAILLFLTFTTACGEFNADISGDDKFSVNPPGDDSDTNPLPNPTPPPPSQDTGTNGSGGISGLSTQSYQGRTYKLYVPTSYNQNVVSPIVLAFHGLGDTFTNFDAVFRSSGWQQVANDNAFIIMVPDHKNSERPSFLHFNGSQPDFLATKQEADEVLDAIYFGVGEDYNIDVHKIYWTGFSEGAVFANLAASILSNEIRAVAIYGGATNRIADQIQRKVPLYFITGTGDFSFNGIQQIANEWQNAGHIVKKDWPGVGHSFSSLSMFISPQQVWNWLENVNAPAVNDSYF